MALNPTVLLRPLNLSSSQDGDDDMSSDDDSSLSSISPTGGGQQAEAAVSNKKTDISAQIAVQRQDAENQIMEDIRQLVRTSCYEAIRDARNDLRNGAIDFGRFSDKVSPILRDHPHIRKTLLALTRPGTDKYVYTYPGEPAMLRPYVKIEDLALDWTTAGDRWSKTCAVCIGNFKPPIRTLDCMHSYCQDCLLKCLAHEAGMSTQDMAEQWSGDNVVDALCPLCKQTSFLHSTPDHREAVFNAMLESYQKDTLKFCCPFDCNDTMTRDEMDAHMEACYRRQFICNKACGEVLRRYELHFDATGCVHYLQEKNRDKDQEVHKLQTELLQLKDWLDASEQERREAASARAAAASSSSAAAAAGGGGGGVKRSRTTDA